MRKDMASFYYLNNTINANDICVHSESGYENGHNDSMLS